MYEAIWCLLVAFILIKLPIFFRRIVKNQGDVFALYVCGYTLGRLWIEALRIDDANYILGLRLNIWVSFIVIALSVVYLIRSNRRGYLSNTQPTS
jgi:prolipoprotein diacylglyceryltransferase